VRFPIQPQAAIIPLLTVFFFNTLSKLSVTMSYSSFIPEVTSAKVRYDSGFTFCLRVGSKPQMILIKRLSVFANIK